MKFAVFLRAILCGSLPPGRYKNWILRWSGWQIGQSCRIGFSFVATRHLRMSDGASIGHGNFIAVDAVILGHRANIGRLNRLKGPFWVILSERASIGNRNEITRAKRGVTWGRSMLKLGIWSKITAQHSVDCTRSVVIDDYSTVAGCGSQIWTHGYLHAPAGLERFRIDGLIRIGHNVYIGSGCIINAGICIGDGITVGSASCVATSLHEPGLYVSQPLRRVDLDYETARHRHPEVRVKNLVEQVVNKHPKSKC